MYTAEELATFPQVKLQSIYAGIKALSKRKFKPPTPPRRRDRKKKRSKVKS
jgi:hypothetical protein